MRNLTLIFALITATPSSGFAASDEIKDSIVQHEKAAIEAFRTHDKKTYAKLCLPSFYEITDSGTVNTLADELKELDDYVLGDYRMEDVTVTLVSDSAALIRYRITAHWSEKGKALPVDSMMASAVWIKTGGDWKAATYQEVKIKHATPD